MIEEQYVSFKTAKLAKEKGFNESCLFVYIDNKLQQIPCEYKPKSNNGYLRNSELNIYTNAISAPTQALLARWLREKHKLFIEVTVDFIRLIREGDSTKYYPIYYYKIVNLKNADYTNNKEEFRFYEEAMEAGLQDALKLL